MSRDCFNHLSNLGFDDFRRMAQDDSMLQQNKTSCAWATELGQKHNWSM